MEAPGAEASAAESQALPGRTGLGKDRPQDGHPCSCELAGALPCAAGGGPWGHNLGQWAAAFPPRAWQEAESTKATHPRPTVAKRRLILGSRAWPGQPDHRQRPQSFQDVLVGTGTGGLSALPPGARRTPAHHAGPWACWGEARPLSGMDAMVSGVFGQRRGRSCHFASVTPERGNCVPDGVSQAEGEARLAASTSQRHDDITLQAFVTSLNYTVTPRATGIYGRWKLLDYIPPARSAGTWLEGGTELHAPAVGPWADLSWPVDPDGAVWMGPWPRTGQTLCT